LEPLEQAVGYIRQADLFLHPQEGVPTEVRAVRQGDYESAIFVNRDALAARVADHSGDGCIWTINQLSSSLAERAPNTFIPAPKNGCTRKEHVTRILNLPVDLDPVRPSKLPSTDTELAATHAVANTIQETLVARGWPQPLVTQSNGVQMFYGCDLEPDDEHLVKEWLVYLKRFETKGVQVDTSVGTTSHLMRVPSGFNRKGGESPDRPFRRSKVVSCPNRVVVTRDQLLDLLPPPSQADAPPLWGQDKTAVCSLVASWLDEQSVPHTREDCGPMAIFRLSTCPFKPQSTSDGRAAIFVFSDGGIGAKCWHAECQKKHLADFRKRIGGWATVRQEYPVTNSEWLAQKHEEQYSHEGTPTGLQVCEKYYVWTKGCYSTWTNEDLRPWVVRTIQTEFTRVADETGKPRLDVTTRKANDVITALKARRVSRDHKAPCWLVAHEWEVDKVLTFTNGILHWPTFFAGGDRADYFRPPTPNLFTLHTLGYDFDPDAKCPVWDQFLDSLWDGQEEKDLLHEWAGYCMTPDTDLQSFLWLVGVSRGGKGTIGKVLQSLIGRQYSASATPRELLHSGHALASLVDKRLLILPDTPRLSGADQKNMTALVKSITGESPHLVNPKGVQQYEARFTLKMMLETNFEQVLPDDTGAVAYRERFLHFTRSFVGREDTELERKLLQELPGIANVALNGLRRLRTQNKFTEPQSSAALAGRIKALGQPLKTFMDARGNNMLKQGATLPKDLLGSYFAFQAEQDEPITYDAHTFYQALHDMDPHILKTQNVGSYVIRPTPTTKATRPRYIVGAETPRDTNYLKRLSK